MIFSHRHHQMRNSLHGKQRGAITMFSAVLILILLTEMVIYATQVGVFEQRKSGNEMRQKQAFHAAELGIQYAQEYLLSYVLDLAGDDDTRGWLSDTYLADEGSGRWVACADADLSNQSHPCFGETLDGETPSGASEPDLRSMSYFYSEDGNSPTAIPMRTDEVLPRTTETVEVFALLCLLDINRDLPQPVQGCLAKDDSRVDEVFFVVTLLARGRSECEVDVNGDITDCLGEALIAQRVGSYGPAPGAGGPGAPLTSKSNFQPNGTIEIVANPNGGGPGVPVSVYVDGDEDGMPICDEVDGTAVDPDSNSWSTCEFQEWYGIDIMPIDYTCRNEPCNCDDQNDRQLSGGNQTAPGFDIVVDPNFPCNLFEHVFQTTEVDEVKPQFTVIKDCAELGPESRGLLWVDSSVGDCKFTNLTTIGSPEDPVFLVFAGDEFQLSGDLYGVLFTTDKDGGRGNFDASGGGTIYGAVIIDGKLEDNVGSNFAIVWNDDLVRLATQRGALGKLYGGWADFHEDWR